MMSSSGDVKQMHVFGEVMKRMMSWMIDHEPEKAAGLLETLSAIQWQQYLTREEATNAVRAMDPEGAWDYDEWCSVMEEHGLEKEKAATYNDYAMWAVMNQVYSDFGESLSRMQGMPLEEIAKGDMVNVFHDMAKSLLTDADGKYHVREYLLG